jgi:hypothetical protein
VTWCSTPAPGIRPADKGSEIHDPPFLDPPASRDEPIDLIAYWPMIIDSIESTTHARFPQHRTSFKSSPVDVHGTEPVEATDDADAEPSQLVHGCDRS